MKNHVKLTFFLLPAAVLFLTGCSANQGDLSQTPGPEDKPTIINPNAPKSPEPPAPPTEDAYSKAGSSTVKKVTPPLSAKTKGVTVRITSAGFIPATITISVGQAVTYLNNDTGNHWPTALAYPRFDAGRGLKPGESYGYVFEQTGVYAITDKLSDTAKGTIYVK